MLTHVGIFTCRLGGNERLAANTTVYAVRVTGHETPQLGQNYNVNLTCNLLGTAIEPNSYRWKKNDTDINRSGPIYSSLP